MKRIVIIAAALLLVTAHADAGTRHVVTRHVVWHAANSGVTVYDHDSPDPNIGWHDDGNGMRVCTQDCDNPEIPGSGYTCRNVQMMGTTWRECDR